MHYEINVAWQGKHFFATAERSLTNPDDAADVYSAIVQRFPREAGFSVTIRKWELYWERCGTGSGRLPSPEALAMWCYVVLYVVGVTDKGTIFELGSVHTTRGAALRYATQNARGREFQLSARPLLSQSDED